MTYVMSDIHGSSTRFESIMKQIKLKPEDTLYVLGDVIDRRKDGIRILRKIMSMDNVKMLLGNHEYMMLNALDRTGDEIYSYHHDLSLWYRNGGQVTHEYLKHIRKSIRKEVFEFLHSLPINIPIEVNNQKYLLVHAAPESMYPGFAFKYDSPTQFAVWSRARPYLLEQEDTIIVFGHTPTTEYQNNNPLEIWVTKRLIGIDCGCAYPPPEAQGSRPAYGRLACLRLDDMKVFYSEENIPEGVEPFDW